MYHCPVTGRVTSTMRDHSHYKNGLRLGIRMRTTESVHAPSTGPMTFTAYYGRISDGMFRAYDHSGYLQVKIGATSVMDIFSREIYIHSKSSSQVHGTQRIATPTLPCVVQVYVPTPVRVTRHVAQNDRIDCSLDVNPLVLTEFGDRVVGPRGSTRKTETPIV